MKTLAMPAGFALVLFLSSCGGHASPFEEGKQYTFTGVVDRVDIMQLTNEDKEQMKVTSIGFKNGDGVTLVGLHPGIGAGKNVEIVAMFKANWQGTDVFSKMEIRVPGESKPAESTPAPTPAPAPAPAPEEKPQ